MGTFVTPSIITYIIGSCYFTMRWLLFSQKKLEKSPENSFLSLIILLLTTTLWPISIPLAFWKILKNRRFEMCNIEPIILTACVFSISFYLT